MRRARPCTRRSTIFASTGAFRSRSFQPARILTVTGIFTAFAIALITAAYGLTLCALADVLTARLKANRRLAGWLEKLAGVLLIGFGLKLGSS